MKTLKIISALSIIGLMLASCVNNKPSGENAETSKDTVRTVWTKDQANAWYQNQGWLVGANFMPSTAINQLEMWQAETFDTATIDRELGWAETLGMNTMRVFLHDLLYQQDAPGFLQRMDIFLDLCKKHHIRPLFVLFDSCWDPFPHLGKQHDPVPHVHNSGWVQSPGKEALLDSTQYPRLEKYVKGVVAHFADDDRILGWDVWNEPDNTNGSSYGKDEIPDKVDYVLPLLKKVFIWTRSANPSQPITSGIWAGDWSTPETLKPIEKLQINESDVISFHNYGSPDDFEKRVQQLQQYGKPLLCTEYMARPNGSTFKGDLPIAKKYNIAMYNWGFVNGKTQTIYPWDSWHKHYTAEPPLWFHDIFHKDGKPYKQDEVDIIRELTGKK